jgi:hypothetical protein
MWTTGVLLVEHWFDTCGTLMCYLWNTGVPHVEHWCATCGTLMCYMWNTGVLLVEHWCATVLVEHWFASCGTLMCYLSNTGMQQVVDWCITCGTRMSYLWNTGVPHLEHWVQCATCALESLQCRIREAYKIVVAKPIRDVIWQKNSMLFSAGTMHTLNHAIVCITDISVANSWQHFK